MVGLIALALAALGFIESSRVAADDWPALWRELAVVDELDAKAPERAAGLEAFIGAHRGRAQGDAPRPALLRATLERLAGRQTNFTWSADRGWPFDREESWFAAQVLASGAERERAVIFALGPLEQASTDVALSRHRLQFAFDVWVDAANHLRLDSALAIGRNLRARAPAPWNAISLSLSAMRAGLPEEGDAALAAEIAKPGTTAADLAVLWDTRGIAALGAGWEARGREALGHALLWGSTDAAVVLARLDLADGQLESARRGFRAVLAEFPESDWARRGFGLTLIPTRAGPQAPAKPGW